MTANDITIRVGTRDEAAKSSLDTLQKRLDDIGKKRVAAAISIKDGPAKTQLDEMQLKLARLTRQAYSPKIGVEGITRASIELDRLGMKLDALGKKNETIWVRVRQSISGALGTGAANMGRAAGIGGGVLAAGSAGLALASPIAAATTAVAAFGAVAAGAYSKANDSLKTLQAAEKAYATASTPKEKAKAYKELQAAQEAVKGPQGQLIAQETQLKDLWGKILTAMTPLVATVGKLGIGVAQDLLPAFTKLATTGAKVAEAFLKPFDQFAKSRAFSQIVDQLAKFGQQAAQLLGPALVQLIKAMLQLFVQLMPSGVKILGVLLPLIVELVTDLTPVIVALAKVTASTLSWLDKTHLLIPALAALGVAITLAGGPITGVVAAIALIAAGFVEAWKKSALFRDIIKDVAKVMLGAGIIILQVNKGIIDSFLSVIGTLLHVLATTLGWVPGIGGALKAASKHFDDFKSGTDGAIDGMIANMRAWQRELGGAKDTSAQASAAIISHFKGQSAAARQGRTDLDAYTTAVQNNSAKSDAVKSARQKLINDLVNAGVSAKDAKKLVDNLGTSVKDLPAGKTLNLVVDANGNVTITGSDGKKYQISAGGYYSPHAAGGIITDGVPYAGAQGDDVLISAKRGEAIVPVSKVPALAPALGAAGIPGFAKGGIVGFGSQFQDKFTDLTADAFGQAGKVAVDAAMRVIKQQISKSAATANYKPGAGVEQWRGVVRSALSQQGLAQNLQDAVLYQMQTESGGNPYAVNLWDSNAKAGHPSVGLMQVIRGTFQAFAGRYRNTGPFAYGVSENPMANVYAALGYARAAYGPTLRNVRGGIGTGHGYAAGGATSPGWAVLGERGRELVKLPGGARVYPHGETEAMLGQGGPVTVQLVIEGGKDDFERFMSTWIKNYVRTKGGGTVQRAFGTGGH